MTNFSEVVRAVVIRKDGFFPSKPWQADLVMTDGQVWKSWQYNFKTKSNLMKIVERYFGSSGDIPVFVSG